MSTKWKNLFTVKNQIITLKRSVYNLHVTFSYNELKKCS